MPAALQAYMQASGTALAWALLLQRPDGTLYGFTSADVPLVLDLTAWGHPAETAFEFTHLQGLDVSSIATTAGFEVDNLELTTLDDGSLFTRDDILAGRWANTRYRLFRYRWDAAPVTIADWVHVRQRGTLGQITPGQTTIRAELRGLTQRLQQPVGIVSTKTCQVRLGSEKCKVGLVPFTTTGLTVTAVASAQQFTAAAATQAADWFGEGTVTWLTGDNAGISHKVRTFEAGVFTLVLPAVLPVQVGDTFAAVAGCRQRLDDCRDKFANVLNFQGDPHRPTTDDLVTAS